MRNVKRLWFGMAVVAMLVVLGTCARSRYMFPVPEAERILGAGFRYSAYGPDYDPGPQYWRRVGQEMAERFEGAVPETIWIVGRLKDDGCLLNFPVEGAHPLILGAETDENESALDLFDDNGYRVWLRPSTRPQQKAPTPRSARTVISPTGDPALRAIHSVHSIGRWYRPRWSMAASRRGRAP